MIRRIMFANMYNLYDVGCTYPYILPVKEAGLEYVRTIAAVKSSMNARS